MGGSLTLCYFAASATLVLSASRSTVTICSSVNRLFLVGSSQGRSHLPRNYWSKELEQVNAVPYLVEMLGFDEKHKVEWNYLNKGTPEEDRAEEFDVGVARRMLETVIKLDEAIEAP